MGIVCLPIHDAMMLAEPDADVAASVMSKLSVEYFGFEPKFKWA
jgi:xylose isomerase